MFSTVCLLILLYAVMGKDIKGLLRRIKDVDWKSKIDKLFSAIEKYSLKAGRVAAKPLLIFYYVMNDDSTTLLERALIYGAIIYVISPVSVLPTRLLGLLGIIDEGAAMMFVYKKIQHHITPDIMLKVNKTLYLWFGPSVEGSI